MGGLADYLFGFRAEDKAAKFLEERGFEIVERNFHSKFGEIDIIARHGDILHFVEVKATNKNYETIYRVDLGGRRIIKKTINFFMLKYNLDLGYEIDAICVGARGIEFYENVSV